MVQFLSIIFSLDSSIFVGFFKSSLFCVTLYFASIDILPRSLSHMTLVKANPKSQLKICNPTKA